MLRDFFSEGSIKRFVLVGVSIVGLLFWKLSFTSFEGTCIHEVSPAHRVKSAKIQGLITFHKQ